MKFINIKSEEIGLLVELPGGTHVVDIAKSLGIFAAHNPMSGALINGVLREKPAWVALVNHWPHLRVPLALLARTALVNPEDPRLAVYPLMPVWQAKEAPPGIVALEITDAADLDIHDPTGRLVIERQIAESVTESAEPDMSSMGGNVQAVDFSCRKAIERGLVNEFETTKRNNSDLRIGNGACWPRLRVTSWPWVQLTVATRRQNMMSFLSFHAAAAARGDGLRPELLALLVDTAAASHTELPSKHEDMSRSGPDPASIDVVGKHTNISFLPQASLR